MSRVGKSPVAIPEGVDVMVENKIFSAKGKYGDLTMVLVDDVAVKVEDGQVVVTPVSKHQRARAMWGMTRSRVASLVQGVHEGFSKRLEISGVGFRASVSGKYLTLALGFSHDVIYAIPEGITIACEKPTVLLVSGADKQMVGQVAAEIRALRKPEPYKGKGIKYEGERIVMKEGKKK